MHCQASGTFRKVRQCVALNPLRLGFGGLIHMVPRTKACLGRQCVALNPLRLGFGGLIHLVPRTKACLGRQCVASRSRHGAPHVQEGR